MMGERHGTHQSTYMSCIGIFIARCGKGEGTLDPGLSIESFLTNGEPEMVLEGRRVSYYTRACEYLVHLGTLADEGQ